LRPWQGFILKIFSEDDRNTIQGLHLLVILEQVSFALKYIEI
jgi:hypothetical protein